MEESKLVDQIQALSLDGERTRSTSDVSEKSDEELELDNNSYNINDIFELLPYSEVSRLIFQRLDMDSKCEARLVCKQWQEFIDPLVVFQPFLWDASFKEVTEFANNSWRKMESLSISKLQNFKYPEDGLQFPDLRSIRLIPFQLRYDSGNFCGISETNLKRLLDEFRALQEIFLHSAALGDVSESFFATVQLLSLESLEVSCFTEDGHGFLVCCNVLENYFPKLKSLKIVIINGDETVYPAPLKYAEVYDFIRRHGDTLKNLHIGLEITVDDIELAEIALERYDYEISDEKFNEIMQGLGSIRLDSIDVSTNPFDGKWQYQFCNKLIASQKYLTKIKIDPLRSIEIWNDLPKLFSSCSATLEEIEIVGCLCHILDTIEMPCFTCSCLKKANRLKVFQLDICGNNISHVEDLPNQIESLALGQGVTGAQINFIASNLPKLRDLKMTQGQASFNNGVPKITVPIFKSIMKKPALRKLIIGKLGCFGPEIKRTVAATCGLEWSATDSSSEPSPNSHYSITVNPKVFDRKAFN